MTRVCSNEWFGGDEADAAASLAGVAARVEWTDLLALAPGREDLNTLG